MADASDDAGLVELARKVGTLLKARGERLATAESCTGGLIAKCLTDVPGSSDWFERGLITYSNAAKTELLGVPDDLLARTGAVSGEVVLSMATGLLRRAPVEWTVAVSGIAGPDGGSVDKPTGTIWIGWAGRMRAASASRLLFAGDRDSVRRQSAANALGGILALLSAER